MLANLTSTSESPICPYNDDNYNEEHYDYQAILDSLYSPVRFQPFSVHMKCVWASGRRTIEFTLFSFLGYAVVVAAMATKMNFPCAAQDNDVYEWSPEQQGIILGAFYWGFVITQVPGAMLSQRYGGKYVMMLGILFSAICSILTPIVVRESKFWVLFNSELLFFLFIIFFFDSRLAWIHWYSLLFCMANVHDLCVPNANGSGMLRRGHDLSVGNNSTSQSVFAASRHIVTAINGSILAVYARSYWVDYIFRSVVHAWHNLFATFSLLFSLFRFFHIFIRRTVLSTLAVNFIIFFSVLSSSSSFSPFFNWNRQPKRPVWLCYVYSVDWAKALCMRHWQTCWRPGCR